MTMAIMISVPSVSVLISLRKMDSFSWNSVKHCNFSCYFYIFSRYISIFERFANYKKTLLDILPGANCSRLDIFTIYRPIRPNSMLPLPVITKITVAHMFDCG